MTMFEKYSERRSDPDFCDEEEEDRVQELGILVVGYKSVELGDQLVEGQLPPRDKKPQRLSFTAHREN